MPPGCWDEDRDPAVRERVLVADAGSDDFEATITVVETDGSLVLVLAVQAFVPAHAE